MRTGFLVPPSRMVRPVLALPVWSVPVVLARTETVAVSNASARHRQEARMDERAIGAPARDGMADGLCRSLGIGVLTGMRSTPALAAPTWPAALGRTRIGWIPSGPEVRGLATAAASAETEDDEMPFAPDRRIEDSLAASLALAFVRAAARPGRM